MRMWMVNPRHMCARHLLGEHVELHMLVSTIRLRRSITGYVRNGLVEPSAIARRHAELVREMTRRGYRHRSLLWQPSLEHLPHEEATAHVNQTESLAELRRRCPTCRSISKVE